MSDKQCVSLDRPRAAGALEDTVFESLYEHINSDAEWHAINVDRMPYSRTDCGAWGGEDGGGREAYGGAKTFDG
jgi:hypothetical protein